MDIQLANVKPDRTSPETAFTATLLVDSNPLFDVVSKPEEHWPDLNYSPKAKNPEATYARLEAHAKASGFEHSYAFVGNLYKTRQKENAEAAAVAAAEQRIRKLCLDYLVIKLPHYADGEYMLASEVSTTLITQMKAKGTLAAKVGGDIHKEQIRLMFAEISGRAWADKIEFYNDRYTVSQGALKLAA